MSNQSDTTYNNNNNIRKQLIQVTKQIEECTIKQHKLQAQRQALEFQEALLREEREEHDRVVKALIDQLEDTHLTPTAARTTRAHSLPSKGAKPAPHPVGSNGGKKHAKRYTSPQKSLSDFAPGDLVTLGTNPGKGQRAVVTARSHQYVYFELFDTTLTTSRRLPRNLSHLHPSSFGDPISHKFLAEVDEHGLAFDVKEKVHLQLDPK